MCGEGDWDGGFWDKDTGRCIGEVLAWEIFCFVTVVGFGVGGGGAIEGVFIQVVLVDDVRLDQPSS